MGVRRARIYDVLALLTVAVVIIVDQWTKALVVEHLSPPRSQDPIPLIGRYLSIYYIQNSGAAFSMFSGSSILVVFIFAAIAVVAYLYIRTINSASLFNKLVFGLIIGGAIGNLIDRALHSGYVVDFLWFQIPEIRYSFAVFNVADACISVGVFLLFVTVLFGGLRRTGDKEHMQQVAAPPRTPSSSTTGSRSLRTEEHDVQP